MSGIASGALPVKSIARLNASTSYLKCRVSRSNRTERLYLEHKGGVKHERESEETQLALNTDVLIIGGGFGGLAAAIRIKELSPEASVLLVDKQTIGWGGKANKGAGVLWVLAPGDDIDAFVDFHVKNIGIYLNDQDLLYAMARESYGAAQKLADWGVKVMKTPKGDLDVSHLPFGWSLAAADLDMMQPLRAKAVKLGVRLLDKTHVVDLLKQEGRVAGAVGFNLLDGGFAVFNSKATILANGDCDFGVMRMWANACGDGIAAAYNAGAEMRNAEFGNFYDVTNKGTGIPIVFGFNCLWNAQGENISTKYIQGPQPDIPISIILGMEKEVMEGRGPIYFDLAEFAKGMRERRGNISMGQTPYQSAFRP